MQRLFWPLSKNDRIRWYSTSRRWHSKGNCFKLGKKNQKKNPKGQTATTLMTFSFQPIRWAYKAYVSVPKSVKDVTLTGLGTERRTALHNDTLTWVVVVVQFSTLAASFRSVISSLTGLFFRWQPARSPTLPLPGFSKQLNGKLLSASSHSQMQLQHFFFQDMHVQFCQAMSLITPTKWW